MTGDEVAQIVEQIGAVWPNQTMSDETAEMWFRALEIEPFAHAEQAVRLLSQSDEFQPSIARFRAIRRGLDQTRAERVVGCGQCDNGWIDVSTVTHVIVAKCPTCTPTKPLLDGGVPPGERLATREQNMAGLAIIRAILAKSNGPLAAALRGAVRGPGAALTPCRVCRQGTARVGPDGHPLCATCETAAMAVAAPVRRPLPDANEPL